MINWLINRKWLAVNTLLVGVLVALLGIQVVDRSDAIDRSVKIGVGNEKVITLGHVAYAAGSLDYTYDGTDDNVQFQAALDALPVTGGRLVDVSAVQKNFSATVTRAIPNVVVTGAGAGSYFVNDGVTPLFTAGGNGWQFESLRTDAGGINMGATTGWLWSKVNNGTSNYDLRTPAGSLINGAITASSITDSGITDGRIPVAGAGGLLGSSANLTFNGSVDTDAATLQDLGALGASAWVVGSNAVALVKTYAETLQAAGFPVWVSDGTNDEVEIEAAIASISTGKILLLGTFNTDGFTIPNGITLVGANKDSTILHITSETDGIIVQTHGDLRNITVSRPYTETFAGKLVSLTGMNGNYKPSIANQFDGLYISRGGEYHSNYGVNTGLYINVIGANGETRWLAPTLGKITTMGFEKAVEIEVDGTLGTAWMWGLTIDSLQMWWPGYGVYMVWEPNGTLNNYLYYTTLNSVFLQAVATTVEGLRISSGYTKVKMYAESDMPVGATSIRIVDPAGSVGSGVDAQFNYVYGSWGRDVVDGGSNTVIWPVNQVSKPVIGTRGQVSDVSSNSTLLYTQSNYVVTNYGATDNVTVTLPNVWYNYYMSFKFVVSAAYQLRISPGATGRITINGAAQTAGKYIYSDTPGDNIELFYHRVGAGDIREWIVTSQFGTWSVEE